MAEIRSGDRTISTAQLTENAARAASGLSSIGIGRGDTVALYLRNDFAFLEASLAAGMVGAYPVPVNWHYTEDEARYLFENSGAKAIIIHADLLAPIRAAIPTNVAVLVVPTPPEIASAYGIAADRAACARQHAGMARWLKGFAPLDAGSAEPPGTIIYTSGTTGRPERRAAHAADAGAARDIRAPFSARGFGFAPGCEAGRDRRRHRRARCITPRRMPMASSPRGIGANVILEPRFDAGRIAAADREASRHAYPHGADHVQPAAEAAGGRAQEIRSVVAEIHRACGGARFAAGQARDDRMVGTGHQRILRRHRNRHRRVLHVAKNGWRIRARSESRFPKPMCA